MNQKEMVMVVVLGVMVLVVAHYINKRMDEREE